MFRRKKTEADIFGKDFNANLFNLFFFFYNNDPLIKEGGSCGAHVRRGIEKKKKD